MTKGRRIAFVGFGDLGVQVKWMLSLQPDVEHIVYFDDLLVRSNTDKARPFEEYYSPDYEDFEFYVCLGYKHLPKKNEIITRLLQSNRNLPSVIHETAYVDPSAMIEKGIVIYPMSNIGQNARIGKGSVLNNSVIISHDTVIGDCCYLAPGVITCGFIEIGDNTFIGAGSVVSNGIRIGRNVIIGTGTVVTQDVPDETSVIGNPMKMLKNRLQLT